MVMTFLLLRPRITHGRDSSSLKESGWHAGCTEGPEPVLIDQSPAFFPHHQLSLSSHSASLRYPEETPNSCRSLFWGSSSMSCSQISLTHHAFSARFTPLPPSIGGTERDVRGYQLDCSGPSARKSQREGFQWGIQVRSGLR